jgi:hypothetical protein
MSDRGVHIDAGTAAMPSRGAREREASPEVMVAKASTRCAGRQRFDELDGRWAAFQRTGIRVARTTWKPGSRPWKPRISGAFGVGRERRPAASAIGDPEVLKLFRCDTLTRMRSKFAAPIGDARVS